MAESRWFCECQRYFIETNEVNSKGNPRSIPVTVRKMHVFGEFIVTDYYRITLVRRSGQTYYSVKQRVKPKRAWWDKTPIKDSECKMVKEGSYSRDEFIKWLKPRIVGDAVGAVVELETCPPENIKEAA